MSEPWWPAVRPRKLLLCSIAGLMLGAWAFYFAGQYRIEHLDLSRFGNCDDVPEALARDSYVGSQLLPFVNAAFLMDVAAFLILIATMGYSSLRFLRLTLGVVLALSTSWHFTAILGTAVF